MHRLTCVTLYDGAQEVTGVEIWGENGEELALGNDLMRLGRYVDYRAIPLYVMKYGCLNVFTRDRKTEEWFKENLVTIAMRLNDNVGLLYEYQNGYLLFYFQQQIKCMVIDLQILNDLDGCVQAKFPSQSRKVSSSNIKIFDKISEKRKSNPFIELHSPQKDLSVLSNQNQVNLAVSKIILSGLRIRGLSTNLNHSINEKLTIKEIYQMTYKATLFSLRKYNYSFNQSDHPITVNELQEIVEKLLEIFIDV